MEAAQAQKHLVHNAALLQVDKFLAKGPLGGFSSFLVLEESLTELSGAFVESSIQIPDRCLLIGVVTRVVQTVTGATSFSCGIEGDTSRFGGSLGVTQGSVNKGVAFSNIYEDTPVRLTANGGDFTGGSIAISIHGIEMNVG